MDPYLRQVSPYPFQYQYPPAYVYPQSILPPYAYTYPYSGEVYLGGYPTGYTAFGGNNLNFGLYHMRRWRYG
jgi:hypothetical protein